MRWKFNLASAVVASALVAAVACSETFPRQMAPTTLDDGLRTRPSNTTCVARNAPPGRIRLEPAFTGFTNPVAMIDRPDLGLVYVAEMPGTLKVIDRASGAVTTALDLVGKVGKVESYEDWGLFGLATHPTEPYVYLTAERAPDESTDPELPFRTELVRFTTYDGGRTFDPASEKIIFRIDRPTFYHSPGTLLFGPDGYVYWGIGDGGATLVPGFDQKHPDTLLGAVIRIDVDGGDPYAIPGDNPFANGGDRPEVFARGFRNPWRFTFDRAKGEIWGGDVGNVAYEEVNKIERGKDYGWPTLEGEECFRPRVGCDRTGLTPPVFVYPHAEGASITGGYVYRGSAMPDLAGKYVFGDFTVGRIWMLDGYPAEPKAVLLNAGGVKPSISSFAEDAEGELYALDWQSGSIYKLVEGEASPAQALPTLLSETGCVEPSDPKTFAPGLVPYGVNVELWSDGSDKRRFVAIPDGTSVHVDEAGGLVLPEGGVLVKEFSIDGKRIETRLLFRQPDGDWSGATYEWNDDQTDAVLLEGGKRKVLANGQTWTFPSPAQCFVCHTKAANIALGFEPLQLNGDFAYGSSLRANQLTKLSEIGYLDARIDPSSTPRLPALSGAAPAEERARAYLHANCSMCHREGTGNGAPMDMRFGLPRAALVGCSRSAFDGKDGVKVLSPGDPDRSAIFLRMTNRDGYQMPPLGTSVVDPTAVSVMEEWIRSLDTCE
jgi:uncharacterized repeat protein (TIGR03806 family)